MISTRILKIVQQKTDIDLDIIKTIYDLYYDFIRFNISNIDFNSIKNTELFDSIRSSFNLPKLGKLSCSFKRLKGLKKKYEKDCIRRNNTNV